MRIGIDIDGVLTNREQFQFDYGAKYCFDNNIKYDVDPSEYNTGGIFNLNETQYKDFWDKYLEFYAINEKAIPFSSEVLNKLKTDGHEIIIITARWTTERKDDVGEKMRNIVKTWLDENKIIYDDLIFSLEDKLSWCIDNKIDVMIEDEPKCITSVSTKIPVICFDATYNRQCEGQNIIRCYSWYDIYNKIKGGI